MIGKNRMVVILLAVCACLTLVFPARGGSATDAALPQVISLDGDWDFTYESKPSWQEAGGQKVPVVPKEGDFTAQMSVPGYWDDHLDRLREAPFWSTARFNPDYRQTEFPLGTNPPDASLPYLLGAGWYRKTFQAPARWQARLVTLQIGGVHQEAWVWLNGNLVGYHLGHSPPFAVPLDKWLKPGAPNTLIVAVSNLRDDRGGCALRGYHGRSAGIYRPVSLKVTGNVRIQTCYIRYLTGQSRLLWSVDLEGRGLGADVTLRWTIRDTENGQVMGSGSVPAAQTDLRWETETFQMRPWSDRAPNLYEIEVSLVRSGAVLDHLNQPFGLRLLEREGTRLRLNGRPVILRGGTEHFYFPLTTTAPLDGNIYRDRIRKLKEVGFNWLRFHTWIPSEEYMQAADELGMMLQVEPPVGFREPEWLDILMVCRKHPSVVIYCPGNEEFLDEERIAFLGQCARLLRTHVPDALFNPQEALRGVEYGWSEKDTRTGTVETPFLHNPQRLAAIKDFSDVIGSYAWGFLSYTSTKGDWRELDRRWAIYERPILTHELGILGNYLNLDLEHRYAGTRIGPDLFAATRQSLAQGGLLDKAALYYRNSSAWMSLLRKQAVEMARKTRAIAGYDMLGPSDMNWHRTGYPCGLLNEFLELKPGESVADVLRYNGESVLLLDHTNQRNLMAGDRFRMDLLASLYGAKPLAQGTLRWRLADDRGTIHQRGEWPLRNVSNGAIAKLGTLDLPLPDLTRPAKLTIFAELSGGDHEIYNDWDFWVFPKAAGADGIAAADEATRKKFGNRYPNLPSLGESDKTGVWIVSALDQRTLDHLRQGGRVMLLGAGPFPTLPTSFQPAVTGRAKGNLATVIADHPLMQHFPHDGYCDWQFYTLLEQGSAVNFSELAVPFDPIIEVVSSFKMIRKQANLFEWQVGDGRLLVCTMNLDLSDPAAGYLLDGMVDYVQSDNFRPRQKVEISTINRLLARTSGIASSGW